MVDTGKWNLDGRIGFEQSLNFPMLTVVGYVNYKSNNIYIIKAQTV